MHRSRLLPPLCLLVVSSIPVVQCQCLTPVAECDLFTCDGCCDSQGLCHPFGGEDDHHCGINGVTCVDCVSAAGTCGSNGVCEPLGDRDGGAGIDAGTPVDAGCDECPRRGVRQCDPNIPNTVDVCRRRNGCLRWVPGFQCSPGSSCDRGECLSNVPDAGVISDGGCLGNCPFLGASQCVGSGGFQFCLNLNGCLMWAPPLPCPPGSTCTQGLCAPSPDGGGCSNQCQFPGQSQCTGSSSGETCSFDPNGCLVWQAFACASTEVCSGGSCVSAADAGPENVGGACSTDQDCGGGFCITQAPGGYCSQFCSSTQPCPTGSICSGVAGPGLCFSSCFPVGTGQANCRTDYVCYGIAGGICLPACQFVQCPPGTSCSDAGYCQ